MKTFVRDSTVRLSFTFLDIAGAIVTPTSATVTLHYPQHGRSTHQTYNLTQSGEAWIYDWDSRVATHGVVQGHAQTGGDAPISSVDFEFRLIANKANREVDE
jgi:hypothetical protein